MRTTSIFLTIFCRSTEPLTQLLLMLLLLHSTASIVVAAPESIDSAQAIEFLEALQSAGANFGGAGGSGSGGGGGDFGIPPPPDPTMFRTPEDLKEYLERLQLYYALVGLPRFGKRAEPGTRSWTFRKPSPSRADRQQLRDRIEGVLVF